MDARRLDIDVSYEGFLKWVYPYTIHFKRILSDIQL